MYMPFCSNELAKARVQTTWERFGSGASAWNGETYQTEHIVAFQELKMESLGVTQDHYVRKVKWAREKVVSGDRK